MSDDLDSLSVVKLSEAFAVEVEGWVKVTKDGDWKTPYFLDKPLNQGGEPHWIDDPEWPKWVTSADAVLPFLEKIRFWRSESFNGTYKVVVSTHDYIEAVATAYTFARAAATALIRAQRAQKGAA